MASTGSSAYTVKLQALWDNTDLKKGSAEAETAIEDLAREFSTTTDSIKADLNTLDTSFRSSLGSSGTMSTSADEGITSTKDKLKHAGSEAASEFTQNFGEAIKQGDPCLLYTSDAADE